VGWEAPDVGILRARLLWGLGVAGLYLLAAALAHREMPFVRILYDGLAPLPPYRWVHAPPGLQSDPRPPEPGAATVPWTPSGSPAVTVTTGDGQCTVILKAAAVAPRGRPAAVRVEIAPLDAGRVAPPPPGFRFDSNAYRIDVRYEPSGSPVLLRSPATVLLRAATGATQMVRWSGSRWTAEVRSIGYPLSVVLVDTRDLGTFALIVPHTSRAARARPWEQAALPLAVLALALLGALCLYRTRRRAPRGR
jgi:hypothetical protein